MKFSQLQRCIFASCLLAPLTPAYHWPSPKFDAIEALLYEASTEPPGSVPLPALLDECVPRDNESTAAEWVRFLGTANSKRKVTLRWESRNGHCEPSPCSTPFIATNDTTTTLTRRNGMSPQKYWFDTPINGTTSIFKFWFEVDENNGKKPVVHDNGGTGYEIQQDRVLFDPARSLNNFNNQFTIIVAIRNDRTPTRVYANVMWRVTFNPSDETVDFSPAPEITPTAGCTFYKAMIHGPNFMFDLFSIVDGVTYSEEGRDTLFIKTGATDGAAVPIGNTALAKRIMRDKLRRDLRDLGRRG